MRCVFANATFTGGRATARSHENRSRGVVLSCRVRWHMRGGMRVPCHARAPQQREQRSRFLHCAYSNSSSSGNRNGCLRLAGGSGGFSGWTGRRLLRDAAASKRNGDGAFIKVAVNSPRPPPIRKDGPKYAKYATATAQNSRVFRSVFDSRKNTEKNVCGLLTPLSDPLLHLALVVFVTSCIKRNFECVLSH